MSKKDYQVIVKILNKHAKYMSVDAFMLLVQDFANALKADNPRFDSGRFMDALLSSEV